MLVKASSSNTIRIIRIQVNKMHHTFIDMHYRYINSKNNTKKLKKIINSSWKIKNPNCDKVILWWSIQVVYEQLMIWYELLVNIEDSSIVDCCLAHWGEWKQNWGIGNGSVKEKLILHTLFTLSLSNEWN